MAGIMVSASTGAMTSLLRKLATLMGEEFARIKNLRKEVKFINDELISMKDALEGLSYLDELDPQTKRWRDIVREMSYDIEDIIDDFMQNVGKSNKNIGFVSNTFGRLKTFRSRHKIANKIQEIKELVLETSARHKRYKVDTPPHKLNMTPYSSVAIDPRVSTLYETTANLVGVEEPTNEIVHLLDVEDKQVKIVSIVGFGGLGKTTLANLVYGRLKGKFNQCAFVPVSQKPNIPKLLHSLLSQVGSATSSHDSELNVLLDQLREHLQNIRYLIVIDDIWDVQAWGVIRCAFPENDLGSRVIVTTRIQDVAKSCCSHQYDHILNIEPLSDEYSRRLFFGRTMGSEEACPDELRDASVEILKKCGGLPLAIISISSMLASEGFSKKERWEYVRDSMGSRTNLTLEGVRQILNLSYKDLPCHLKTCLLYLGMYPEDYTMERSNLERQWMAEGFISKENGQDLAKTASNYFNELANRSLIQPVEYDSGESVTRCKLHDMMLDLILLKSTEENFFTIVDDPQAVVGLDYKARRLSIRLDGTTDVQTILPRNICMSQVRSVMFFGISEKMSLLTEFKLLRVLFIDLDCPKVDLTGLCELHQLRYLCINYLCSYQLQKEISMLQHLETLGLPSFDSLPTDLVYLPRLKHLVIIGRLPDGIDNMKFLQHLCAFDIAVNTLDNIKGLSGLTNLRSLYISCRRYIDDMEERNALRTSLENLCCLEYLFLSFVGCIDDLVPLSPPMTPYRLETFIVSPNCGFSMVPCWIGELRNLVKLQFTVSELLYDGVSILAKLPFLTHLSIVNRRRSIREMIIIYGEEAFPALKSFELRLCSASYLAFFVGAMPKLQRLKLMFNADLSEHNGSTPMGIEHLLALNEVSAEIGCYCLKESETCIEHAFISVMSMHPSHPRVIIKFLDYNLGFFDH